MKKKTAKNKSFRFPFLQTKTKTKTKRSSNPNQIKTSQDKKNQLEKPKRLEI